jgi:hypothetical protein
VRFLETGSPVARPDRIRSPHPRVAATFALIPLIVGLEIPVVALSDSLEGWLRNVFGGDPIANVLAWAPVMLFPGVMLCLGCLVIWWPTVNWTPRRWVRLLVISLLFALLLLLAGVVPRLLGWRNDSAILTLLATSLVASGLALFAMAQICHDPVEPAKVACPSCGYDLRGQRECRCPECGRQFTVGELTRGRAGDER